jgi:hypothetical protein
MQGGAMAALQLFRQPVRQDGVDSSARLAGRFGSFGFRAVGRATERQEGNGCGDAVRLLARGILRGV